VLDEGTRLRTFIENFGLAFVNAAAPVHVTFLSLLASVEADNTTSARKRNARTAPVADCSSAESTQGLRRP
jgi:hypothetical protein